jgi:DNA-binding CsgD family transcriptional regulator
MAEPKEPLTERELEVVRLVATGIGNKEIAAQLHVSPNTVRVHLRNIFTKLEAQSRTEVTMMAVRNGWVDAGVAPAPIEEEALATETQFVETAAATIVPEPQPAFPNTPIMAPVPVAPNPQPLPPLSLARKMAMVLAMFAFAALTIGLLQPASTDAALQPADVLLAEGLPNPTAADSPATPTRWYPRASVRTARSRMATVAQNNLVYVIGGEVDRAPSGEMLIYDPRSDAWTEAPNKPTPVMNTSAAIASNVIYVPGGTAAGAIATDRFEAYDLQGKVWKVLPALPKPVAGHAVVAHNNRIYVLGGRTLSGLNSEMWMFDIESGQWSLTPAMPTPRSQLAATVLNNRIYAIGGFDGQREYNTCEYFDIAANRWESCAPMTIPRGGLGLAQAGAALYAVGGGINGFVGFNEQYDPNADKWVPFELPQQRLGEWRNAGVASTGTEFYTIGGITRGVPLSDNYVYEVMNNRTFLPAFQSGSDK